jgi:hypothetical protein
MAPPSHGSEVGPPWYASVLELAGAPTPPPILPAAERWNENRESGKRRQEGERLAAGEMRLR